MRETVKAKNRRICAIRGAQPCVLQVWSVCVAWHWVAWPCIL